MKKLQRRKDMEQEGIMVVTEQIKVQYFKTSANGKLTFLNNKIEVFEYEANENGNTNGKIWE